MLKERVFGNLSWSTRQSIFDQIPFWGVFINGSSLISPSIFKFKLLPVFLIKPDSHTCWSDQDLLVVIWPATRKQLINEWGKKPGDVTIYHNAHNVIMCIYILYIYAYTSTHRYIHYKHRCTSMSLSISLYVYIYIYIIYIYTYL